MDSQSYFEFLLWGSDLIYDLQKGIVERQIAYLDFEQMTAGTIDTKTDYEQKDKFKDPS